MTDEQNVEQAEVTTEDVTRGDDSSLSLPMSEGVTKSNDSDDDAILENIFGDEPEGDTVAEATQETTEPTAEEATDAPDAETTSEPGGIEGYDKAVAALQRDGVPRSVIDEMAEENPQSLVEWGLKRAKVQSDVDGYGAKIKELEEKAGVSEGDEADDVAAETGDDDQVAGQPDAVAQFNRHETEIAEIFGEDAAKAVMDPMRELIQETGNALRQQQEAIIRLTASLEEREVMEARDHLRERFPRLDNDEDFGVVLDQMSKLAQVGEYDSFNDLMTDSYRLKFAEMAAADANDATVRAAKNAGQPTTSSESRTPPRSKGTADREDAALDALISGGGFDAARSAYEG